MHVSLPGGEVEEIDAGAGFVSTRQEFATGTDAEILEGVRDALGSLGLSGSVSVLHPLGPAPSVKVVVPGSESVNWTIDDLRQKVEDEIGVPEAILLELTDSTGAPLLVSGVNYRTGEGALWFEDGQDERFGALHGGGPSRLD